MIKPAKNRKIILQSPSGTRNAIGERVTTWTNVATVWAEISPLSVRDLLAAGQMQSEVTHRVRVRYGASIAAIDSSWRVLYGTRIFVISGVRNINEAGREFELLCHEGLRDE
mgnify:CR=1 FL=1